MRRAGFTCGIVSCVLLVSAPQAMPALSAEGGGASTPITSTPNAVTPMDLMRLRDIGPLHATEQDRLFSLSPDGTHLAFQIRQADPIANSYRFRMYVMPTAGGLPTVVDSGGDYIKDVFSIGDFALSTPSGVSKVITPKWSADGKWIAYLRRDDGVTQAWRAAVDGGGAAPISHVPFDVEAVDWTGDGNIIIMGRPGLQAAAADIEREGQGGFLFGNRFRPQAGARPQIREPIPKVYIVIDVASGASRPATSAEQAILEPGLDPGFGNTTQLQAVAATGGIAWAASKAKDDISAPTVIHVDVGGKVKVEETQSHDELVGLFWDRQGTTLYYINREGWGLSQTALYRWKNSDAKPVRVFATEDMLLGCQPHLTEMICAHESSLQPRRLVRIILATGQMDPLYDPNPEFKTLHLGQTRRLQWTNAYGVQTYGDLVLPPDHKPGQTHPLIVVQYQTRGFLRGGTGDEYPIQVFAAHGFAVLSLQGPMSRAYLGGAKTWQDVGKLDLADWSDRRSILSSLETGVQKVIDLGVVDSERMGITGLSDGATTVNFALINSHRFRAAAISSCCMERSAFGFLASTWGLQLAHSYGYPSLTKPNEAFWKPISLVTNARAMNTPLLMQLADQEYLGALEGYQALKEADKPAEMDVFPDENHIKWQPAHRLAVYNRDLDWFEFWLKDIKDPDAAKTAQYDRWERLRTQRQEHLSGSPGP